MEEDGHLVRLALADPAQYGKLIGKHWQTLIGLAYQRLRDMTEAEEVVQRGFIQAYKSLADLREADRFLPWIVRIVSRLAGEESQRRRRTAVVPLDGIREPATGGGPVMGEEPSRALDALAELPEPYRLTLTLRFQENLTGAEISTLLGEPSGTIRSRITRGIRLLKEKLEHELRAG